MKSVRPTLEDVARLAGVSLGSASRALSVPGEVKPQTLERVQRAVEQLGYVRNGAAQALASRRTHTIAAIYPTLNNPVYADSMHFLQQGLWECGYQLLIASHDYRPEREVAVVRALVERGVDGLVLSGTDHAVEVFDMMHKYNLPYVLMWSTDESSYAHRVGFSNHAAAYRMARLVLDCGHTQIALCTGDPQGNERVRSRLAGTRAALREVGIELRPDWLLEQPFTFEGGRQALRQLMERAERPTVLICGTDLQAIGAMDECRRRGISVPGEISVTGFDDIEQAVLMDPALTTVHVPAREIGVCAARRIVGLVEGKELPPLQPLDAPLVVRGSLRNPPVRDACLRQEAVERLR